MRFFLDTEFIESGPLHPIELISIGIVAEDGRSYYAINRDFNHKRASDWVRQHVLAQLEQPSLIPRSTTCEIAIQVIDFVWPGKLKRDATRPKPEFWGYYADYDWVVFCQLFGTMMALPKRFPMYCRDIKQLCDDLGNPELPQQGKGEHNALADARWNKVAFEYLQRLAVERKI